MRLEDNRNVQENNLKEKMMKYEGSRIERQQEKVLGETGPKGTVFFH